MAKRDDEGTEARLEEVHGEKNDTQFYCVGKAYLIRCVTNYWVGIVRAINPTEIKLRPAAWVALTGRFGECIKKGFKGLQNSEGEAVPSAIVHRGAVVDAIPWAHEIPEKSWPE